MSRSNNRNKSSKRSKRRNRRFNPRQRRNNIGRMSTGREGSLIKDRTIVKLRVAEYFADDPGSPNQNYLWVGNGLFDPFGTSSTAQPAGFQNWMRFYAKYRVLRCRVKLEATATQQNWCVIYPSIITTPLPTIVAASAQPFARRRMIGINTGTSVSYINNHMMSDKVFGQSVFNDENFSGDITSNPPNKWYWQVTFFSSGGDAAVFFIATLEFDIMFYGRLAQDETSPLFTEFLPTIEEEKKTEVI